MKVFISILITKSILLPDNNKFKCAIENNNALSKIAQDIL